jgi:integrase
VAIYKRNGIYHCDFTVNGERYRQTLETGDKREAIQRERDLIARAKEGKLAAGTTAEFSRLMLSAALDRYLNECALRSPQFKADGRPIDPRKTWAGWVTTPLRTFFAAKRLNQINADDIRQFQAHRLAQGKHPNTVNHETNALFRLLKRAKLLSRLRDDVQQLPAKKEPKSMLTPAERQHLFETASIKPAWQTAYCAALLTANASMRPKELRRLLWRDLDPFNRIITVRRSKTEAGTRVIPLNDEAWSAIAALKQRADTLGTYAPEYYIFHRQWPKIDPTRPLGAWRSAWRSLRKAAGMPRFRFYDLRHQFVTELLEAGVPEGVIRELAGHVDPEMTRHYSHPRLAARRAAVEMLGAFKPASSREENVEGGSVTNLDTKALPAASEESEVVEKIGRDGQI